MLPTPTPIGGRLCVALGLVAAAAGCDRPEDEVEPTPAPFEVQVPGTLGPPLIEPSPSPPTDPSVPAAPDPRDPNLPPESHKPELPSNDPVPTESAPTG